MKKTLVGKAMPPWNKLIQDEKGTAIAEYALVTVFIGFAGFVLFTLLPAAIRAYVEVIYFVVSLPIP